MLKSLHCAKQHVNVVESAHIIFTEKQKGDSKSTNVLDIF